MMYCPMPDRCSGLWLGPADCNTPAASYPMPPHEVYACSVPAHSALLPPHPDAPNGPPALFPEQHGPGCLLAAQVHWPVPRARMWGSRRATFAEWANSRAPLDVLPPYYTAGKLEQLLHAAKQGSKARFWQGVQEILAASQGLQGDMLPTMDMPKVRVDGCAFVLGWLGCVRHENVAVLLLCGQCGLAGLPDPCCVNE